MNFKEDIMEKISTEIEALLPTVVDNKEDLGRCQKLMSIYASYTAIRLNQVQIDMTKSSQEMMKHIDFSKVDFNEFIKTLRGDG